MKKSITWRAIFLGLILIPINCFWLVDMEAIWYSGRSTIISLFFNVVFSIWILVLLNLLLKRFLSKSALRQGELLTIYVMLCMASTVAGHGMTQILVPTMGHPFWFATPENEWRDLFWRYIPRWLSVSNRDVLRGYYEGDSTLYTIEHIKGWLSPVLWWTAFIFALVFVMLCINALVRKQWTEKEKLSYPVIQLPLQMTSSGFVSSKLLWLGFAIAAIIELINGLNFFFPMIPEIPIRARDVGYLLTERPWNAVGWLPISFYPFVIGLGFFIPLGLLFSCWFFYLFWKAQMIIASVMGLQGLPSFPSIREQSFGGYIALCLIAIWATRGHLKQVFKKVFGGKSDLDDSDEPMRYKSAIIGIVSGMLFITLFCYRALMSIWVILLFFAVYFAISIAVTRMRAELGIPVHDLHLAGPAQFITTVVGTRQLARSDLTMFSLFWFFTRAYYCHPMPHQLEGFKLAERIGIDNRKLMFAMVLAVVTGTLSAFWGLLHFSYKFGIGARFPFPSVTSWGNEIFNNLQYWISFPRQADYPAMGFMGGGLAFAIFLIAMRMRFLWWPFHPAAYAVSSSYMMNWIWFCLFISWSVKWIILKYGGLRAHRRAIPFFFGLILGQYTVGSLWTITGLVFNIPIYGFFT